MKVGDKIWLFDQNHRVYDNKLENGRPIYREYWREVTITGETSRSWVIGSWGMKAPKQGPHKGFAFTLAEVDDDVWAQDHRYKIERYIARATPDQLRQVANIVGYTLQEDGK